MTPDKTCTRHNLWPMTRQLWVRVDAGTGMGMLKSTHGLPVPLPTPHSQHSIILAPQADVGTSSPSTLIAVGMASLSSVNSSSSTLLPLPEDFVLPHISPLPNALPLVLGHNYLVPL
jgi:hypothetical protein